MSNELNEVNIPNIKISNTDLEVLEKKTLFFPESLFKKQQVNTIKSNNNYIKNFNNNINNNFNNIKSFNNFNNINNNFNNNINYFNNKSKLYTIKSLNNRPFSYPMKFT
jgi:hypothetical protein